MKREQNICNRKKRIRRKRKKKANKRNADFTEVIRGAMESGRRIKDAFAV